LNQLASSGEKLKNLMTQLVVIDCESTGLTDPIGVVEFAAIFLSPDLKVTHEYSVLVNPGRLIEPGAEAIHGISDNEVAHAPGLVEALSPLADCPIVAIGHNVAFDLRLVDAHLDIVGNLCTLALSRQYVLDSPNHKLATLKEFCSLPERGSHRALDDAHTSLELLRWISKNTTWTLRS
jgi:DNA polymerase III epsilon subunit-like protein